MRCSTRSSRSRGARPRPRLPRRRDRRPRCPLASPHRRGGAPTTASRAASSPAIAARSPVQPTTRPKRTLDWSPRPESPSSACRCAICTCRTAAAERDDPALARRHAAARDEARGIPVAVASDNTRDPFYAYGDLDMLEVFREAVRIAHLDHPFGAWPAAVDPHARRDHAACPSAAGLPRRRRPTWCCSARRGWTRAAVPAAERTASCCAPAARSTATLPDYRELDEQLG